jgi:excisionase family DNA binding protein
MLYIKLMTVSEVAKRFKVAEITVYKWIERGLLNAVKVDPDKNPRGVEWNIPETDVQTFEQTYSPRPGPKGSKPRADINLECTKEEMQAANIRPGLSARERYLWLKYAAGLDRSEWPELEG